ncbi:carbon-nitrogen hydrolase family protein [Jeotgalicoccus nanhaiensis]|uniref:Carbon-nitrogen hydrolase family protein n=1 Tax=Jeotgalicoccus nanhaiensis TaxID=568603 RepID=A0ABR9XYT9_9STAP|nr:carbon-nitrogen hydrolase family protein [Jeotgalicoccus nanhaiensis]MBF0754153.1 carbon-nitrogen hydrolase family protein [Jeotgalicoccus nanhaiensis]TFU61340.1 carbon-nitrogen hydrolase family protein [Jeotgalicoccus nanhaiensis]
MKIALVQMNTKQDKAKNLNDITNFIEEAASEGAELVSLPEYCTYMGKDEDKVKHAESIPNGETFELLSNLAKTHSIFIHVGSILEEYNNEKSYNTSFIINPHGEIIGKYQKIHLFDIEIEGVSKYMESNSIINGTSPKMIDLPVGKAGLSICYDMRFPELYRGYALEGAKILFIPAAFTRYTGMLHWELILRARAVENQCFVIAAGQFGENLPGKECFGSSMVIDPWGMVISRASEGTGVIYANLDMDLVDKARTSIPSLQNRKPEYYKELS